MKFFFTPGITVSSRLIKDTEFTQTTVKAKSQFIETQTHNCHTFNK